MVAGLVGICCGCPDGDISDPVVFDVVCCSCSDADRAECAGHANSAYLVWAAKAESIGLKLNRDCKERLVDWHPLELSCPADPKPWLQGCENSCSVYFGTASLGEACELVGPHMSSCRDGLQCGADEACHEPCDAPTVATLGQPCSYGRGVGAVTCEPGSRCGGTGACIAAPQPGEPCDDEGRCDTQGYCQGGTCLARKPEGTECSADDECGSGYCPGAYTCAASAPVTCTRWLW